MNVIKEWSKLTQAETKIIAIEYYQPELLDILLSFKEEATQLKLPVYYWNVGYNYIQEIQTLSSLKVNKKNQHSFDNKVTFIPTSLNIEEDVLLFLAKTELSGIFVIEDSQLSNQNLHFQQKYQAQLANLFWRYESSNLEQYLVIIGDYIELGNKLNSLIPKLKYSLPNIDEVSSIIRSFCQEKLANNLKDNQDNLIRACQGLSRGEIKLILHRYWGLNNSYLKLTEMIINYKKQKFKNEGLEFISEPDIPTVGGMDLILNHVHNLVKLMTPEAKKYHIKPPKGMLLLGPPGTGKSLVAKLTAKTLGVPLLGVSWGNILSSNQPDKSLTNLLEIAVTINAILLFDDFDKGFTGWQSQADGGVARRLSQKLLTWMQEHTSYAFVIATINRLEMIPSELRRRFNDLFFVDIPHLGAIYDIFQLHLSKYFPRQFNQNLSSPWTKKQWYSLLKSYLGCTPAEIGNAVARCAERNFCQGKPGEITLEDLQYQRTQFVLLSETYTEDIQHIRNYATYAQPASSKDNSEFAITTQNLFEYQPHPFA